MWLCARQDEQATRMGLGTAIMGCKEDGKVKVKDLIEVSGAAPLQPSSDDLLFEWRRFVYPVEWVR